MHINQLIPFHLREDYGWNKQIKCFVDHLHRAGEAGGASKNTSFCQWSPPPSTLREKSTVGKSLWFWCTSRSFSTIYQILFAQLNISVWSNQNYQNSPHEISINYKNCWWGEGKSDLLWWWWWWWMGKRDILEFENVHFGSIRPVWVGQGVVGVWIDGHVITGRIPNPKETNHPPTSQTSSAIWQKIQS